MRSHGRSFPDFDYSPMSIQREQRAGSYNETSFHEPDHAVDELAPNLAVIEELEEIRDMIESKSRDLFQKEILLSHSMDQIQIRKLEFMESIEHESSKMLAAAEARLEAKFDHGIQKFGKLISRIETRIAHLKEVFSRIILEDRQCAATPPIPSNEMGLNNMDILGILSASPPSVKSHLVAACILLILGDPFGKSQEAFLVSSTMAYVRDLMDDFFQTLLEVSVKVDIGESVRDTNENDSKFQQAQRGILLKRLNVPEAYYAQPIEIHIHSGPTKLKNSGNKISLEREVRKHDKINSSWTELIRGVRDDLKALPLLNPLNPFEETKDAQIVQAAMNTRVTGKGFMYRFLAAVFTPSLTDNDIQPLSKILTTETVSVSDRFIAFQVGMFLLEWIRGTDNAKLSEIVIIRLMENSVSQTAKDYEALLQLLSNWKQGVWNMLRVSLNVKTPSSEEKLFYLRLLEHLNPRDLIAAWTPTIIARIERGLIHEALVGRIKSLIQSRPG